MSYRFVKHLLPGNWLYHLLLWMFLPQLALRADQIVYDDALENGWQNWGWATLNYANTSPVHSGSYSISVTMGGCGPEFSCIIQTWIRPRIRASVSG